MTVTFDWSSVATRYIEKAVEAGYPEAELRELVEKRAVAQLESDNATALTETLSIWYWNVTEAARALRKRKAHRALPILDSSCNVVNAAPTSPPGGFTYTLFEWGKGRVNPETHMWEEGQEVDGKWVAGKVPMCNKNGTPLSRDVIGRFLAGMSGESGNFRTNGKNIRSYGWKLAYWGEKNGKPAVFFGEKLWESPYSPTTGGHMSDVVTHLSDRAVNSKAFPQNNITSIAQAIAHSALRGNSMDGMRSGFSYNYRFAPPWKKIFAMARTILRQKMADQRKTAINYLNNLAKDIYTKESVAAYRAWANQSVNGPLALLNAYEDRLISAQTPDGKRWPAVPNRFPKEPTLIKKDPLVSEKKAILGWWFSHDLTLGYGDGRTIGVGVTHEVNKQPIVACDYGLHASRQIGQAYSYVSGRYLCRVMQWGVVDQQSDKLASQFRRYLAVYDTRTFPGFGESVGPFLDMIREAERGGKLDEFEAWILALMGLTADQRTPVAVPEVSQG